MKTQEWLIVGLLLWWLWPRKREEVGVSISEATKQCMFPDGTLVEVEFDAPCPYDDVYGGQSWEYYVASGVPMVNNGVVNN